MADTTASPQTEEEFITGLFPSHKFPSSAPSTSTSSSSSSSSSSSTLTPSHKPTFDEQAIHLALRETHRQGTFRPLIPTRQDRKEARELAKKDAMETLHLCHGPPARAVEEAQSLLQGFEGGVEAAVKSDNVAMLKAFLVGSGDELLHRRDADGATLLHSCCLHSAVNCLGLLVGMGVDIDAVDTAYLGMTPLITAARIGEADICRILVRNGANVRAVDCHGDTALHHAVREGNGLVVQVVLAETEALRKGTAKGLLDVRNGKGRSCADLAKGEAVRLLLARIRLRQREKEERRKSGLGKLKMGVSKISLTRVRQKGKGKGKRKVKERTG